MRMYKGLIVVGLAAVLHLVAEAGSAKIDGRTWYYESWGTSATITSVSPNDGDVVIPSSIDSLPVTGIGSDAFWKCSKLTSVSIPDGVTRIANFAFYGCSSLKSVLIPDSVTYIGSSAFGYCSSLKSFEIPSGVKNLYDDTFLFCTDLTTISIPDGVRNIGSAVFHHCTNLTSVTIPNSVTNIGGLAFYACTSMKSIDISDSLESIGGECFGGCWSLTSVKIPDSVTSIGDFAFDTCRSLTSVVLPKNLSCIDAWTFEFCGALKEITIPDSVVDIKRRAFYECRSLASFEIPNSVTNVGQGAFQYCTNLTSVVIPRSVECIGYQAFLDCGNLRIVSVLCGDKERVSAMLTESGFDVSKVQWQFELPPPKVSVGDGTIIDHPIAVTITSDVEGATVHCTTDGSEPTISSPTQKKLTVAGKMTIKAIAEYEGVVSDIETVRIGLGKCEPPVISASKGMNFSSGNNEITLSCATEGAQIRYTLDGRDPTLYGVPYSKPFAISDTTTIRAVAVDHRDYLDSEMIEAVLTRVWSRVECPTILEQTSLFGESNVRVTLGCATVGAEIHYTIDGSDPDSRSAIYSGPIIVKDGTKIKAVAEKYDFLDSEIVAFDIKKNWTYGEALNLAGHVFTCPGSAQWEFDGDVTYDGVMALRSGNIRDNESSELRLAVSGPGVLKFVWKASCEYTVTPELLLYDHGEFCIGGQRMAYTQGESDWAAVEISINDPGDHELIWRYVKDESDRDGEDCVWLDCVSWTGSPKIEDGVVPSSITGGNEDLTVNGSWVTTDLVERYGEGKDIAFCEMYGSDLSAALLKPTGKKDASGNPLFVWQDYVAGTDPTDPNSLFRVSVEMVDGRPVITWEPNLNENGVCRVYTIYGKYELSDAKWHTPTNGLSRFFKVGVSMPGQGGSTGEEDPQDGEEGLLLHRWSFNGNLLDSVGGSDAAVGGSVFQGEKEYTLRGGASGSSYIDLGDDLFPTDGSAVTMEIWATCRSASPGWTRIWQFGDMPQGYDFSSYNTSMYSENYIGMCWNGKSKFSSDDGEWDNYSWTSFTRFNEAYLSVVYAPNGDGSWTVSYRHIDVISGETIGQHSFSTKGSDWSLASVGQSECLLGQALTCWDDCANASYNEVRIWNRALSEAEQKAHVAAGPDAVLAK